MDCKLIDDVETLPVRLEIDKVGLQACNTGTLKERETVISLEAQGKAEL